MRHLRIWVLLSLCLTSAGVAQDFSKGEIFGGFQFTRLNPGGLNSGGWNAAAQYNWSRNFGVKADFSGAYKGVVLGGAQIRQHTYLFGPVLSARTGRGNTIFAHALFGGARSTFDGNNTGIPSSSENAFAMAFGGGYDWNVNQSFAIRLAQFDYLPTRFGNDTQNNFRYSVGIVFKF
jgi:opacity protein-like surface antigen